MCKNTSPMYKYSMKWCKNKANLNNLGYQFIMNMKLRTLFMYKYATVQYLRYVKYSLVV